MFSKRQKFFGLFLLGLLFLILVSCGKKPNGVRLPEVLLYATSSTSTYACPWCATTYVIDVQGDSVSDSIVHVGDQAYPPFEYELTASPDGRYLLIHEISKTLVWDVVGGKAVKWLDAALVTFAGNQVVGSNARVLTFWSYPGFDSLGQDSTPFVDLKFDGQFLWGHKPYSGVGHLDSLNFAQYDLTTRHIVKEWSRISFDWAFGAHQYELGLNGVKYFVGSTYLSAVDFNQGWVVFHVALEESSRSAHNYIAVTPDWREVWLWGVGSMLMGPEAPSTIFVYDAMTGVLIRKIPVPGRQQIADICFHPYLPIAYATYATRSGPILVINAETGEIEKTISIGQGLYPQSLAVAPRP